MTEEKGFNTSFCLSLLPPSPLFFLSMCLPPHTSSPHLTLLGYVQYECKSNAAGHRLATLAAGKEAATLGHQDESTGKVNHKTVSFTPPCQCAALDCVPSSA